ncbi:MAG: alpha/beta fold hydrolase [Bacteroidales bacterium]|nr:alpha/beta fold hydrolase [Bacteroidales bacterium]
MRFSEDRMEKLTCSDGIDRDIHIWEPDRSRAVMLAIHGGMAHGGDYLTPALYFKKHGIATVAHDLHGHDLKEKVYIPRFEVFLDDLGLMIEWTKEQYAGLPVFILGHSMGGLIATLYGLDRLGNDPQIKGFIISSPYYVNAIKAPWILLKIAGLLSVVAPKMTVPIEDSKPYLTLDKEIYQRHLDDESNHIRAAHVSARFASELLKAQQYIPDQIAGWKHPLLAFVAGDDRLADAGATRQLLGKIDPGVLTEHYYPENFHENFNEINREEIFSIIVEWVDQLAVGASIHA